jgi:hypothetical protein
MSEPIRITYRFTGSTFVARAGSGKKAITASSTNSAAGACRRAAAKAFGYTKNEADYVVGRAAEIVLNPEPKTFGYDNGHTFASEKGGA